MPNQRGSNLISRLAANNVTVLEKADSVAKPISDIYDIEETKEVATLLCGLLNAIVNKGNLSDYLSLLPELYTALNGVQAVDDEVLDMTIDEVLELRNHIKSKLDFINEANAYEEIVEDLIVYTVGIAKTIARAIQIKGQLASDG